ncbi:MAG: helix-turn-helix domain-containing protein [Pseudomonadota bacterium]
MSAVIGIAQDLMLRSSRDRLLAILARFAGLRSAHPPDPVVVDLTQAELAAIANLSRSSTSPILLGLEKEGVLRLRRASIEVLKPDVLLRIVDG